MRDATLVLQSDDLGEEGSTRAGSGSQHYNRPQPSRICRGIVGSRATANDFLRGHDNDERQVCFCVPITYLYPEIWAILAGLSDMNWA
jgi:hypothetical protein